MIRTVLTTTASAMALVMAVPAAAEQPDAHGSQPGDLDMLVQDGGDADDVPMPTMSFGDWGVDTSLLSDTIDPGDDFFAYVNQEWLDANPLPAEFSRFGAFNLLREKSTSDVKALVDELVAKPASELTADEKRIVEAYASYNDTAAIDAAGLAPAQPYLDKIRGAKTLSELVTLWGTPGYPAPMGGGVSVDAKEPTRYSVYLGSGGLGLPDRDYYLDDSERGKDIQTKYREYLTFLFDQAGYADAAGMAENVYAFEDSIARKVSWDRATRRNRDLTYNALSPEELGKLVEGFPTTAMLTASGFADTDRFIVGDLPPTAEEAEALGLDEATLAKIGGGTPAMMTLLLDTPMDVLQAWTIKEFLEGNAAVLPSKFDEADFAFYGKTLNGTPEQRARWKRAIGETEGLLGELVGKSYVERYFPAENKAAMVDLVANLRKALAQSIDENDWMSAATKKEALAKLDAFDPKIGYRDNLETYQGLAITDGNPLANRMAAAEWSWKDNLSKLGGPIDQERDRLPRRDPAAAVLRADRRRGRQLWRDRRRDRARDGPRLRRSGLQVGRHRHAAQLVDRCGPCGVRRADRRSGCPVRRFLPARRRRNLRQRAPDAGREHRRPGRAQPRLSRVQAQPRWQGRQGDRRPDRRSALLSRLGAGVAFGTARGKLSPAAARRSAQPRGIPRQRRRS